MGHGKRHQQVDICCNTIGLWAIPEPDVTEQNYLRRYQKMAKKQQKTAQPLLHRLLRNLAATYGRNFLTKFLPLAGPCWISEAFTPAGTQWISPHRHPG